MSKQLFQEIASRIQAMENCEKSNNFEWLNKHKARILQLVKDHMPSGSGFDSGTVIDFDASTSEKLVFDTSFHHMDEHGHYDGWTDHTVTVEPSLVYGFTLIDVSGQNRNDIKDYISETFDIVLTTEVD
jgi:hypothetical protein